MIFLRSLWIGSTLLALAIGCLGFVSAEAQENLDRQSGPSPRLADVGLTVRLDETIQAGASPMGAAPSIGGVDSRILNDSINPLWAIPVASLSATRDRPIFSSSRRR